MPDDPAARSRRTRLLRVVLGWLLLGMLLAGVAAGAVLVMRFTMNEVPDDDPDIAVRDGLTRVVWAWWDGADFEIKIARVPSMGGSEILSDNTANDTRPQIDGTFVGWLSGTAPGFKQVIVWDEARREQRPVSALQMGLDGFTLTNDRVAWADVQAGDTEILCWERSSEETIQITSDTRMDLAPDAGGDFVVWQGYDGTDWEVFAWDAASRETTRVTDNAFDDTSPVTDGTIAVWVRGEASESELWWCDLESGASQRLTTNTVRDSVPVIGEGLVAWTSGEDTATEIFAWEPPYGEPERLTQNEVWDGEPAASSDIVTWLERSEDSSEQVWWWDVQVRDPVPLTQTSWRNWPPAVDDRQIAWSGEHLGQDTELYYADLGEPATVASITGTVTAERDGTPIPDILVTAYARTSSGAWFEEAYDVTNSTGGYALYGLGDGTYRVRFSDPDGLYVSEYYDDAEDIESADDISTEESATVSAIDAALAMAPEPPPVDGTPPSVSDDATGTYVSSATISIIATDTESGVASISYQLDDETTVTVQAESATVTTSAIGSHELTYLAEDNAGNVSTPVVRAFEIIAGPPPTPTESERLAGPDRFASSVAIARAAFDPAADGTWPGVSDAVIASGEDRSATDALAAAGLCWTYDAPLLLVSSTGVPEPVAAALAQMRAANGAVRLWIVGGERAVPGDPVVDELVRIAGGDAARVAGADRYATARACAWRMYEDGYGSWDTTLPAMLLANGADPPSFADALALSPIAARQGAPVLLVRHDSVPAPTASELQSRSFETVVIAGGPVAVSARNEGTIAALAGQAPERWFGADRYETATAVATEAEKRDWLSAGTVGVAARLPDALSGGAAVGMEGGVLLFTRTDRLPASTGRWIAARKDDVRACWVLGGPLSVEQAVTDALDDALR